MISSTHNTNAHFKMVSMDYHKFWFYGKDTPYEKWQLDRIINHFQGPDCSPATNQMSFADIGGGTGRFASLIREKLKIERSVFCADLSASMLEDAKQLPGVETQCLGAVEFAREAKAETFDRLLVKEVVHLIPESDLVEMYDNLFKCTRPGGVCLTITRPREEIQYPFCKQAQRVWKDNQLDSSVLKSAMEAGGFNVEVVHETFPVTMKKEEWIAFVRNRIWSTFSTTNFSDQQLDESIEDIKRAYPSTDGNITFNEVVVFLRALKP